MTRNLTKGDIVGIAYNNYIYPAIYRQSTKSSYQFYLIYSDDMIRNIENAVQQNKRPYTNYINRVAGQLSSPIVRLNILDLTDEHQDYAYRALNALRKIGVI